MYVERLGPGAKLPYTKKDSMDSFMVLLLMNFCDKILFCIIFGFFIEGDISGNKAALESLICPRFNNYVL
jgi:hypothetical protein